MYLLKTCSYNTVKRCYVGNCLVSSHSALSYKLIRDVTKLFYKHVLYFLSFNANRYLKIQRWLQNSSLIYIPNINYPCDQTLMTGKLVATLGTPTTLSARLFTVRYRGFVALNSDHLSLHGR